jgi:glutamyl-tRNA synthetase
LLSSIFLYNLQGVTKDATGQVTGVTAELHLAGDFKKTKLKLTWLADVPDLVPLTLTEFDYLITKKKVRN